MAINCLERLLKKIRIVNLTRFKKVTVIYYFKNRQVICPLFPKPLFRNNIVKLAKFIDLPKGEINQRVELIN